MLLHSNCSNLQIRAVPSLLPLKNLKIKETDLLTYMLPKATVKTTSKKIFNVAILTAGKSTGVNSKRRGFRAYLKEENLVCSDLPGPIVKHISNPIIILSNSFEKICDKY